MKDRFKNIQGIHFILFAVLCIFSTRLFIIFQYSSPLPYRDDWAIGMFLHQVSQAEHFDLTLLFSPHNEHRIVFTRLVNLFIFHWTGQWTPQYEMIFSALLHCLSIALIFLFIWRNESRFLPVAVCFSILIFSFPFSYKSVLMAFQSQFYFLLFFSVCSCLLTSRKQSGKWSNLACIILAVMAFFSTSSGSLLLLIPVWALLLENRLPGKSEMILWILTASFFLSLFVHCPHHDALKAASVGSLVQSIFKHFSWPLAGIPLFWLPVFFLYKDWYSGLRSPFRKFLILLSLTLLSQFLAMAYFRGGFGFPTIRNRYLEIHILMSLVQFLAAMQGFHSSKTKRSAFSALVGVALILGLIIQARETIRLSLPAYLQTIQNANQLFLDYKQSNDPQILESKEGSLHTPFPDSKFLIQIDKTTSPFRRKENIFKGR